MSDTNLPEPRLGDCAWCGRFGVDLDATGADGESVCDECRDGNVNGNGLAPGTPVRLTRPVDRYPHFLAPTGAKGVVADVGDRQIVLAVTMDEPLKGAEEWENQIHWFGVSLAEALVDVEVIEARDLIVRFDVTGMDEDDVQALAFNAEAQGDADDIHPAAPVQSWLEPPFPPETAYLEEATALGIDVELDRHDIDMVKAILREVRLLDPSEVPAAVRAVNDGATVADRDSYKEVPVTTTKFVPTIDQIATATAAVIRKGQDFSFGKPDERDFVRMVTEAIGAPEPANIEQIADAIYRDHGETIQSAEALVAFVFDHLPASEAPPAPTQPTVSLRIDGSVIAFEETGEILETVEYLADGSPDWSQAAVCDYRGGGGQEGFRLLREALEAAEANAALMVVGGTDEIVRVPRQS